MFQLLAQKKNSHPGNRLIPAQRNSYYLVAPGILSAVYTEDILNYRQHYNSAHLLCCKEPLQITDAFVCKLKIEHKKQIIKIANYKRTYD